MFKVKLEKRLGSSVDLLLEGPGEFEVHAFLTLTRANLKKKLQDTLGAAVAGRLAYIASITDG